MSDKTPRIRPENLPAPLEYDECKPLIDWMELRGLYYVHVPNEGERTPQMAAKLKRIGMKPGFLDYLIFDRPPKQVFFVGVAFDMKRTKGGKVSGPQRVCAAALSARRWYTFFPKGAHAAIRELTELGY